MKGSTMFKTSMQRARLLLVDDRFKLGGAMYRIRMITRNASVTTIEAYDIKDHSHQIRVELPHHTRMKIYNQR